jgi:Holliday junction resolvase
MSGKYSRDKGLRFEREIVNLLRSRGLDAKRISMQETGGIDKGDLKVLNYRAEVKGGKQVPIFVYKARKTDEQLLFMRRDKCKWLVCMDFDFWIKTYYTEGS